MYRTERNAEESRRLSEFERTCRREISLSRINEKGKSERRRRKEDEMVMDELGW